MTTRYLVVVVDLYLVMNRQTCTVRSLIGRGSKALADNTPMVDIKARVRRQQHSFGSTQNTPINRMQPYEKENRLRKSP